MNTFDWNQLRQLVLFGARDAFTEVRNQHADQELFGYCLYSDDSGTTLLHTVGHRERDWPTQDDDEYWNPHEWELQEGLAHLDPAQRLIAEYYEATAEADQTAFRDQVFDTVVAALAELRSSGFFAPQAYVLFSVSQWTEQDVLPWVEQLNPESLVTLYRKWMVSNAGISTAPEPRHASATAAFSDDEQQFLCRAACGQLKELTSLHQAGVRAVVVDEALVLAAWKGKADVCSFLLSAGAKAGHRGYRGKTALEFATQEGRKRVVGLLSAAANLPDADDVEAANRAELDQEILHLIRVVIPQLRAARG